MCGWRNILFPATSFTVLEDMKTKHALTLVFVWMGVAVGEVLASGQAVSLGPACERYEFDRLDSDVHIGSLDEAVEFLSTRVDDALLGKLNSPRMHTTGIYGYDEETFCLAYFLETEWINSNNVTSLRRELAAAGISGVGWAAQTLALAVRDPENATQYVEWVQALKFRDDADQRIRVPSPEVCKSDPEASVRTASFLLYGGESWYELRTLPYCVASADQIFVFAWERGWFAAPAELLGSARRRPDVQVE